MEKSDGTDIYRCAEILKALAHPVRLKIACGLSKKGVCNVGKMAENLGIPQPAVSQHLNVLRNAGVVSGYRNGTRICYRLDSPETLEIIRCMLNAGKTPEQILSVYRAESKKFVSDTAGVRLYK